MKKIICIFLALLALFALVYGILFITGRFGDDEDGSPDLFAPRIRPTGRDEEESARGDGVYRVVLDAGHGGHDAGTLSPDGERLEKDDVLLLTLRVEEMLREKDEDIEILLTRSEDVYVDPTERCNIANEWGADIFVALHRNSGGGNGLEVWKASDAEKPERKLTEEIHNRLLEVGEPRDRGIRSGTPSDANGDFIVNKHTEMCSCLLELGFMDSESDNAWYDKHFDDIADAIAEGILAYLKVYG